MQKACVTLLICGIVGCSPSAPTPPRPEVAKKALEELVRERSGGRIRLADFKKTDGMTKEVSGVKQYVLEFEGQIEMLADGYWNADGSNPYYWEFSNKQFSHNTEFSKVVYGNNMWNSGNDIRRAKKGEIVLMHGNVTFSKKESGWVIEGIWIISKYKGIPAFNSDGSPNN